LCFLCRHKQLLFTAGRLRRCLRCLLLLLLLCLFL
jgi:hypothetical protein